MLNLHTLVEVEQSRLVWLNLYLPTYLPVCVSVLEQVAASAWKINDRHNMYMHAFYGAAEGRWEKEKEEGGRMVGSARSRVQEDVHTVHMYVRTR